MSKDELVLKLNKGCRFKETIGLKKERKYVEINPNTNQFIPLTDAQWKMIYPDFTTYKIVETLESNFKLYWKDENKVA